MDYKQTLNITLNDKDPHAMPQRASLPTREPEIQKFWDEIDIYRLSLEKDAPRGTFLLHDGPPYSNGNIHLGHALNKIAKDIVVKSRTMQGYRAPYVPGWDNHGMPIENEVSKEFLKKGEKPDKATMRRRCREYAAVFVERQKAQFKRLGVRGDWENPYLTMNPVFESRIVETFGALAEKGFLYRGLRPVMWCMVCETALADAEIEYPDEGHTSNSIYVRFPVHRDPNNLFGGGATDPEGAYVVIWTTTPWTIPANLALAVHPDERYLIAEVAGSKYLIAEPLLEKTLALVAPAQPYHTVWAGQGSELEGVVAWHPLNPTIHRTSPVVFADYVTMEDGTGIVHTAPGHGKEDFETGKRYGLEVLTPVDSAGRFTKQATERFAGARILGGGADTLVIEALRESGNLLRHQPYQHKYPHCWRCHNPLIFRATVQWFLNIDHDGHRQKSLDAIHETQWIPARSISRIASMVTNRPDWCLSRQRAWGVGIPAFYCRDCGKETLAKEVIASVAAKVAAESSDVWFLRPAAELLPEGYACTHCGGTTWDKESDILDVWFDSGSSWYAVLESGQWEGLSAPADLYLEGSDQHRGWFNSSLMVSVGVTGHAPYRAVVTNGFTVDEQGRKMSKSEKNGVEPEAVIAEYGADILRLWVTSADYFDEVRASDNLIKQVAETYRRIRNTFRFLVNNLHDTENGVVVHTFDPAVDAVPDAEMLEIDRWILARLDRVVAACVEGYETYEFSRVYQVVNGFCVTDLSAFYLDVLKDRLYCSGAASAERRSAQTALYTLAETLARLLAPVLSHTAEEVWRLLGGTNKPVSVHLAEMPTADPERHAALLAKWEPILAAREEVNQAVEAARQAKTIGNPLEARVEVAADEETYRALHPLADALPVVFKVSQVAVSNGRAEGMTAQVTPADGTKCARCWLIKTDVGTDAAHSDLCARCAAVVSALS